MPVFAYLIETGYDPMNYSREDDPAYEANTAILRTLWGLETGQDAIEWRPSLKKNWELEYI